MDAISRTWLGLVLLIGVVIPAQAGLEPLKKNYSTGEPIVIHIPDCKALGASAWVAIYDADKPPQQYTSGDWMRMNKGKACDFTFRARRKAGEYVIRLFGDGGYKPKEWINITVAGGAVAEPKKAAPAPIDNKNFWIELAKNKVAPGQSLTANVNCHQNTTAYPGKDMLVVLVKAGSAPTGRPVGKFMKNWFYLKNHKPGNPCFLPFTAPSENGNYELRVYKLDSKQVDASLKFAVGSDGGSSQRASFKIPENAPAGEAYKPHQGVSECIELAGKQSITNTCRIPVLVYMLQLDGGSAFKPVDHGQLAAKSEKPLSFEPKLMVGWFACPKDDASCLTRLACLENVALNWSRVIDTQIQCKIRPQYVSP
ncbi:MAG: hypothetical protein AAF493_09120 [Pseudomonadota bacterium]